MWPWQAQLKILKELHPTATTISDLDPTSVANIAAGELGNTSASTRPSDRRHRNDGHDHSYDLAVFALAFTCRLRRLQADRAEATRGAALSDHRPQTAETAVVHASSKLLLAPPTAAMVVDAPNDGFISALLRLQSPRRWQTLARAADPGMQVETLPAPTRLFSPSLAVVFSRSELSANAEGVLGADRQPE